jgi:hypothetical protein
MDIVIPYLDVPHGELEYCIKGIEKNVPHNKIHVIKTAPDKSYLSYAIVHDQEKKILYALQELVETDDFYLFNDDFFIMDRVKRIPIYHRGLLIDHINQRTRFDSYTESLKQTYDYLKRLGIKEPLSYELHVPLKMNTQKRLDLHFKCVDEFRKGKKLQMRSIYGNVYNIGGTFMADNKIQDLDSISKELYISTTDKSFSQGKIGEYIRSVL